MRILGIDPGLERIGYGLVLREGSALRPIEFGLIESPRVALPDRLRLIDEQFRELLARHAPDAVATERQLFAANKTTALDVAKSLGVILLACGQKGLPWAEYTPPQVKLAVVGTGAADKKQVQFMVTKLLGLEKAPKPDDVADALAVAICHAFQSRISLTAR
ncbi:MAG TPA: crossover junction endodeoxyribonuclease RuvC [Fimbriimonadaceae bacterium]|nr:crossover junction endodeoxyribonuclease RuvC [Fimbriimonadaceae bacterium]